jgi:uncharacterized protein with HEPN domain
MSKRSAALLLEDIVEAGQNVKAYVAGMSFEQFIEDPKTRDAVVRNFEIIGEAAANLPEDFVNEYSNINWRRVVGMRNRLVHGYFGVDYRIVWNVITDYLDPFLQTIRGISRENAG